MDPVGPSGETMIDYSVFDAIRAGFSELVFVIRKEIEQPFRDSVGSRFEQRIAVKYAFQELDQLPAGYTFPPERTKPWGTAQAVLSAHGALKQPFAVINADDYYGSQAFTLLADHLRSKSEADAMVGFTLQNTLSEFGPVSRGICQVSTDGYLEALTEVTRIELVGMDAEILSNASDTERLTGDEVVSMNMWGFRTSIFPKLRDVFSRFLQDSAQELKAECYLPSAVNELLSTGQSKVKVLRSTDPWFGVTYREDRDRVMKCIAALVQSGKYEAPLWK